MQQQKTCIYDSDHNYIIDEIKRRYCIEYKIQIHNDDN